MNKIIICDLDGTIVDSRADLTKTVNLVRAQYGLGLIDMDTVTGYIGNGSRVLMQRSLNEIEVNIDEAYELMQKFYIENVLGETTVYPGVEDGIKILRANGYKMAIATNKPQKPTEELIGSLNFSKYFDIILGGSHEHELKPDPAMLNIALQKSGSCPQLSWMIGDNYTDLESARRQGIQSCYANYGFGSKGNETPALSVDSFSEFAYFITILNEELEHE